MIAATVVFVYLAVVLYVGIFAFRKKEGTEEFFVASRSLGTFVFLLSLFGSNMTSFAILGSSGLAFRSGIGVYGLMASISGIVIPMSLFLIGTRLWTIGKRFKHITQVQILRDRFEMAHIGTLVFALEAAMLVPYIIIGVMGGGEKMLEGVSGGAVPYWFGGLIVVLVVMSYVFFGGIGGTAWVNTLQTLMFLTFGTIAFVLVARGMGGMRETVQRMARTLEVAATAPANAGSPSPLKLADGALLTRSRMEPWQYLSYMFIPLSSIMFPHIAIFCLTAKKLASFKKTVILYPLCIMAIWFPAVYLGAVAGGQPKIVADMAVRSDGAERWLKQKGHPPPPRLTAILAVSKDPKAQTLLADVRGGKLTVEALGPRLLEIKEPALRPELRRLAGSNSDGVMLRLLDLFSPALLAGLLGAAIMACVMASDSQILALSTMFSEDVFAFYGGRKRLGEQAQVWAARAFVVLCTVAAYAIALAVHGSESIFNIAITYAFSGYASLAPIMIACLFWKRGTKWGVLASSLWIAAFMIGSAILQARTQHLAPAAPGSANPIWSIGSFTVLMRESSSITFSHLRLLLVAPMFIGSAVLLVLVSWLTRPPSKATIERYFPRHGEF